METPCNSRNDENTVLTELACQLSLRVNGYIVRLRLVSYECGDRRENGVFKKDILQYLIDEHMYKKSSAIEILSKCNATWKSLVDPLTKKSCDLLDQNDLYPVLSKVIVAKPIKRRRDMIKKCLLVLDLDETLVHRIKDKASLSKDVQVHQIEYEGKIMYYTIRNHAAEMFKIDADIVIATKSLQSLAEIVVKHVLKQDVRVFGREYFGNSPKSLRAMKLDVKMYCKILALDDSIMEYVYENSSNFTVRNVARFSHNPNDHHLFTVLDFVRSYFEQ